MTFKQWRRTGNTSAKAPAKMQLRKFIYVSDRKLEDLFDEISQISVNLLKELSVEVKVDLKVVSGTVAKAEHPTATRMGKLKVVERFIDRREHVGTVQEPGTRFFRGTLPMQWGWLQDTFAVDDAEPPTDVAFFYGKRDGNVVALFGSRHHVLGEQPLLKDAPVSAYSLTPNIMSALRKHVSALDNRRPGYLEFLDGWAVNQPNAGLRAAVYAYEASEGLDGPVQWMEFLAERLDEAQLPQGHGVLATPVYVAHADPE